MHHLIVYVSSTALDALRWQVCDSLSPIKSFHDTKLVLLKFPLSDDIVESVSRLFYLEFERGHSQRQDMVSTLVLMAHFLQDLTCPDSKAEHETNLVLSIQKNNSVTMISRFANSYLDHAHPLTRILKRVKLDMHTSTLNNTIPLQRLVRKHRRIHISPPIEDPEDYEYDSRRRASPSRSSSQIRSRSWSRSRSRSRTY